VASEARYCPDIPNRTVLLRLRTGSVRAECERRATSRACAHSETHAVSGRFETDSCALGASQGHGIQLPPRRALKLKFRIIVRPNAARPVLQRLIAKAASGINLRAHSPNVRIGPKADIAEASTAASQTGEPNPAIALPNLWKFFWRAGLWPLPLAARNRLPSSEIRQSELPSPPRAALNPHAGQTVPLLW